MFYDLQNAPPTEDETITETNSSFESNTTNQSGSSSTTEFTRNISNKPEEFIPIPTSSKTADQKSFNDFAVPISKQEPASKKRAFPATKHSPERNVRRMTTTTNIPRTPPLPRIPIQRTSPGKAAPRRISTLTSQKPQKPTITPPMTPIININNDLNQRIRVCVRKRPLNKKEKDMQQSDIVNLVGERTIQLNVPK